MRPYTSHEILFINAAKIIGNGKTSELFSAITFFTTANGDANMTVHTDIPAYPTTDWMVA